MKAKLIPWSAGCANNLLPAYPMACSNSWGSTFKACWSLAMLRSYHGMFAEPILPHLGCCSIFQHCFISCLFLCSLLLVAARVKFAAEKCSSLCAKKSLWQCRITLRIQTELCDDPVGAPGAPFLNSQGLQFISINDLSFLERTGFSWLHARVYNVPSTWTDPFPL